MSEVKKPEYRPIGPNYNGKRTMEFYNNTAYNRGLDDMLKYHDQELAKKDKRIEELEDEILEARYEAMKEDL